jgi:DnaJ-class molecular chaperone
MPKDLYVVLGVSRGADLNKIKKAYRIIAKKYHPDISASQESLEKFHEVREAYETLGDAQKRRQYDEALAEQNSPLRITKVPENILARRRSYDEMEQRVSFLDEFFSGMVPGFFGRERHKDLSLEMVLSPLEAERGGLFNVTVPVLEPCPRCKKSGAWENFFCPLCFGRGRVHEERHFSLSVPPRIGDGTRISLSLEDIGLRDVQVHILVTVSAYAAEGEW